jgi:hypothetical protein
MAPAVSWPSDAAARMRRSVSERPSRVDGYSRPRRLGEEAQLGRVLAGDGAQSGGVGRAEGGPGVNCQPERLGLQLGGGVEHLIDAVRRVGEEGRPAA